MLNVGTRVYALGAIALGGVGLAWGDFALVWQPVPAGFPGRTLLAYLFAAALLLAGLALCYHATAARAAAALCALFALVVLLHVPRVVRHPDVYGAWSGLAEQLALVAGGWLAYYLCRTPGSPRSIGRLEDGVRIFAVCLLIFGGAHFFYLEETAALVPRWLPPNQEFWAATTGLAHLLAGLALVSGVLAQLAAILVSVMFASFSALVHIPLLFADPRSHLNWVMNAMNLALTGAAWVTADALGALLRRRR